MELVGAFTNRDLATEFATGREGRLLLDPREETGHLPFAALVSIQSEYADDFIEAADVGAYVCFRRVIKARPPAIVESAETGQRGGKIAVFPMVRREDLTHEQADSYWRDQHAPLALRVHEAMAFYIQLSIAHVIHGPAWDGIAHCGFATLEDLRTRFYGSAAGQQAVEQDVRMFADPKRSPRRLICDEYVFSAGLAD